MAPEPSCPTCGAPIVEFDPRDGREPEFVCTRNAEHDPFAAPEDPS